MIRLARLSHPKASSTASSAHEGPRGEKTLEDDGKTMGGHGKRLIAIVSTTADGEHIVDSSAPSIRTNTGRQHFAYPLSLNVTCSQGGVVQAPHWAVNLMPRSYYSRVTAPHARHSASHFA